MIIETDLGHDPDDLFAILWLLSIGYNIKAITLSTGSKHQILLANFIRDYLQLDFRIGIYKYSENQYSNFYKTIINRYNLSNINYESANNIYNNISSNEDLLIIGPPKNVNIQSPINKIVMQGGFCPYSQYLPNIILDKFKDRHSIGSFNVNGNKKLSQQIGKSELSRRTYFVGKNICHTISFDKDRYYQCKPHNRASELFCELMKLLLTQQDSKLFHDPVAACLFVNPSCGIWKTGYPIYAKNEWTTILTPTITNVLVDINYDQFWNNITTFSYEKEN